MDDVRRHLLSILASDVFRRSPHASRLLTYLVDCAIAGSVPKEYVIATDALGRSPDFDPRTDPVVRVEVRRLRQKLLEYYAEAGRDSSLVLDLPKGGYGLTWRDRPRPDEPLSIAVLPFENLTGDPSKEYFVDGLTEELTSELARAVELRVVARTSAFVFKNRPTDARDVGRRLNVSNLVEGSVRWSNGRIRATLQLVETESGFHRWAETHEVAEHDILGCQQELAARLREALLLGIKPRDAAAVAADPPDAEAYAMLLRARHHWHARTPEGVAKALRLEELNSRFPGYAARGRRVPSATACWVSTLPPDPWHSGDLALECGTRTRLAPNLAEAHAAQGWAIGQYRFDHAGSERHLQRAIELKPSYAMARYVWGMAACALRRFDEALRYVESAVELDPLSMVAHRGVAYVWFARGDLERAREHVLQALDLSPRAPFATYLHGLIEAEAGNTDLGVTLLQRAIAQAGGTWSFVEGFIAYYQARAGQPEVAEASERRLGEIDPPNHMALALAALGRHDIPEAIHQLELAAGARDPFLVHIADHPPLTQLLAEPRATSLYRRLNLPVG
jgi:TolB-like protein/Flp pilus assembly protein TadD